MRRKYRFIFYSFLISFLLFLAVFKTVSAWLFAGVGLSYWPGVSCDDGVPKFGCFNSSP